MKLSAMFHIVRFPLLFAALLVLAACGQAGSGGKLKDRNTPQANIMPPPMLRAGTDTPVPTAAQQQIELTPEEDIVFTDPDNPDASLPELSTLLSASPRRRGPWEQSETIARRRAVREGKPILIWFTDSARSPMCKALNEEVFSKPDFESWAAEKLVRMRVDANAQVDDADLSLDEKETRLVELKAYVTRMKKQYKVLGQPVVVMLNPSGEVVGRYRGYKRGEADFYWGRIKQGEVASSHAYKSWRASLEATGYREWHDRADRSVFAKLTSYSQGTLTLVEPDGTRSRTHENKLSDEDRGWLAEQKKIRGM